MRRILLLLLSAAPLALQAVPVGAQGIRVTGVSTVRYVDVREMVIDSLPRSVTVAEEGTLRRTVDGTIVRCVPGEAFCHYLRSGSRISTVPATQDIEASAWGFGEGVRLYAQLRARTGLGEVEELWPQAQDELDLMAAFAELDRERFRIRLGRQWASTGLGFYNFDGAALVVRPPLSGLSIDAYGGWSLVRGVNEPHTSDLLESVEPFAPDERAYLIGGGFRYRPSPRGSVSALYQREIRTDRASLYSERIAADGRLRYGGATLTGRLTYDVAATELNEGRVRLDLPELLAVRPYVQYRHYQPFFELWTIWGAFSPVGYDEAAAGASWRPQARDLTLTIRGGYRDYGDPEAGFALDPVRNDGWFLGGDASWRPDPDWSVFGGYRADINFGAARSEGDVGVRRAFGDRGYAGASAITFRNVQEFRVGESNVYGGGLEAGLKIASDARVDGRLFVYRRSDEADTPTVDWTQVRGWVRVQWTIGRDPGLAAGGMP